ncbi:MAG: hypothetical protein GX119_07915 [Syntrophomonadaceae bacterium]|jgi:hypothetical protein|nr:hypothetical protein [Syntrophomonadaceae bacterium]
MRKRNLDTLYQLLENYEERVAQRIALGELNRKLLPPGGCCFYWEPGENRQDKGKQRIVRVESYPLEDAKRSMYSQLIKHRGTIAGTFKGGGDHRQSLLRHHIGTALINKNREFCDTWEGETANAAVRKKEHLLETMVSRVSIQMEVLVIPFKNIDAIKLKYIEQNLIALLSNWGKKALDPPSSEWLGHYCGNVLVRDSGLWNTNGVMLKYDPQLISLLSVMLDP